MAYLFQTIAKTAKVTAAPGTPEYRNWFRDRAQRIARVQSEKLISGNKEYLMKSLKPQDIGRMVMFQYDAKTKDKLPYWDMFPLIFPIGFYPDGFLGINLHYLPPLYRAKLMDQLYRIANNTKYDMTTKLRVSYEILNSAARFKLFRPCVKRYLFSHIKSRFLHISAEEWDFACMLPAQRFQKAPASKVWRDSLNKVRNS